MNKQESIKKYEDLFETHHVFPLVAIIRVLEDLRQLDEPEKVQVPQFVAEYIKHAKEIGRDLQDAMNSTTIHEEVDQWLYTDDNIDLFARAWLDGYEVEKEKRYTVKIKGELEENLLVYGLGVKKYFFTRFYDSSKKGKHTRKELEEAGFSEVFNSPLFEVEEVME